MEYVNVKDNYVKVDKLFNNSTSTSTLPFI